MIDSSTNLTIYIHRHNKTRVSLPFFTLLLGTGIRVSELSWNNYTLMMD